MGEGKLSPFFSKNMPTYLQLRQEILLALDQKANATGDLKTQVDNAMQRVMDELAADVAPSELFATEGPIDVTSVTTSVPLGLGGFGATDLAEIYGVAVDTTGLGAPDDIKMWQEMSYEAYLLANSQNLGNIRDMSSWVYQPSDQSIVLTQTPSATETWGIYLYYYRQPATVADGVTPELPVLHHRTIVYGAVLQFPQFFSGDRRELFTTFARQYEKAKGRLLGHRRKAKAFKTLFPAGSMRSRGGIDWSGDTSV